jgi:hypothetical protein
MFALNQFHGDHLSQTWLGQHVLCAPFGAQKEHGPGKKLGSTWEAA